MPQYKVELARARQAVALLQRARAAHFGDPVGRAAPAKEPDLDSLRPREDFRAFLAGLAKAAK